MPSISDEEFGTIKIIKSAKSTSIRLRVGTDGTLRASAPLYAPLLLVKRLIRTSRPQIRSMLAEHQRSAVFTEVTPIGKSHHIVTRPTSESKAHIAYHGQQIIVSLPPQEAIENPNVQSLIRPVVIKAIRKEAKSYLPRRLAFLANEHHFSYKKVRFSHAAGRWGSCSSSGTISLNIALMKLPFPVIDYVLIHELSHTVEMNHSERFWSTVARCYPDYKSARRALKTQTPSI